MYNTIGYLSRVKLKKLKPHVLFDPYFHQITLDVSGLNKQNLNSERKNNIKNYI